MKDKKIKFDNKCNFLVDNGLQITICKSTNEPLSKEDLTKIQAFIEMVKKETN